RFAAELPSAQIAQVLGKTDDATRMLLSRAMRRLREEWSR
ncbi:MAG: sigma factor-like helix-turn-helix DNA-binding protein, partial [Ktedonobacterales bacterium]